MSSYESQFLYTPCNFYWILILQILHFMAFLMFLMYAFKMCYLLHIWWSNEWIIQAFIIDFWLCVLVSVPLEQSCEYSIQCPMHYKISLLESGNRNYFQLCTYSMNYFCVSFCGCLLYTGGFQPMNTGTRVSISQTLEWCLLLFHGTHMSSNLSPSFWGQLLFVTLI